MRKRCEGEGQRTKSGIRRLPSFSPSLSLHKAAERGTELWGTEGPPRCIRNSRIRNQPHPRLATSPPRRIPTPLQRRPVAVALHCNHAPMQPRPAESPSRCRYAQPGPRPAASPPRCRSAPLRPRPVGACDLLGAISVGRIRLNNNCREPVADTAGSLVQ